MLIMDDNKEETKSLAVMSVSSYTIVYAQQFDVFFASGAEV